MRFFSRKKDEVHATSVYLIPESLTVRRTLSEFKHTLLDSTPFTFLVTDFRINISILG